MFSFTTTTILTNAILALLPGLALLCLLLKAASPSFSGRH
jgi:hypothetical protein